MAMNIVEAGATFPLEKNVPLDSLISRIGQILQRYQVLSLTVDTEKIDVVHIGMRESTRNSLTGLLEVLECDSREWSGDLLQMMLEESVHRDGRPVRAIFCKNREVVLYLTGVTKKVDNILGAEIIETDELSSHQLVMGIAQSSTSQIGDIKHIAIIEIPVKGNVRKIDKTYRL